MADKKEVKVDPVEESVAEEQQPTVNYEEEYQKVATAYNELVAKFNKLLAAYNTLFDNYISGK